MKSWTQPFWLAAPNIDEPTLPTVAGTAATAGRHEPILPIATR